MAAAAPVLFITINLSSTQKPRNHQMEEPNRNRRLTRSEASLQSLSWPVGTFTRKAALPRSPKSDGASTNAPKKNSRGLKGSQTESARPNGIESQHSRSRKNPNLAPIDTSPIPNTAESIWSGRTISNTIPLTIPNRLAQITSEKGVAGSLGRSPSFLPEKVTLLVGQDAVPVIAHKNVLSESSPYFQAAFKPVWSQQEEGILRLPADCPDTIATLVLWTHGHHLSIPNSVLDFQKGACLDYDPLQTRHGLFVKLYLAADKYLMPELRNDAIDGILVSAWDVGDMIKMSDYIYENTCASSELRKLLVQLVLYSYNTSSWRWHRDFIGSELRLDLDTAIVEKRDRPLFYGYGFYISPKIDFCKRFHTHDKEVGGFCTELKDRILHDVSERF